MRKVLLCPPKYYDIEYEINPWMHIENKVDKDKVWQEYENLKNLYKSLNIEILEIEPKGDVPDMVYAANYGFVKDKTFIKANFKFPQRRAESIYSKLYFQNLGYEVKEIPDEIYFEGQGDLLCTKNKYFMGWGKRSSLEAKKYLEEFLQSEVMELELIDPYFYHLDTSFAPLDEETVVINKNDFRVEGFEKINNSLKNVILANDIDNKVLACNLVVVGKNVVIGKGISDELRNSIQNLGFKIYEVEMSEYNKGGGSVKCLTLEFF